MIIAFAGLPATGKSTIARAVRERLEAVILDKDHIRSSLFPPDTIEYSRRQDDFCMAVAYQVAEYLFEQDPTRCVILDGRTFSSRDQVQALVAFASRVRQPLKLIECVCADETARARLAGDVLASRHPAADRDFNLYLRLKSKAIPIPPPKLLLNTDQPLELCVRVCLDYIQASGA